MNETRDTFKGFIQEQTDLGNEAWMKDHNLAMECRDLEDAIGRGIEFYKRIREFDRSFSKAVRTGVAKFDLEIARDIESAYRWWLGPISTVCQAEERLRSLGHTVDGFRDLLELFEECPARGFDLDGVTEAVAQYNQGKRISLGELNGFRD